MQDLGDLVRLSTPLRRTFVALAFEKGLLNSTTVTLHSGSSIIDTTLAGHKLPLTLNKKSYAR